MCYKIWLPISHNIGGKCQHKSMKCQVIEQWLASYKVPQMLHNMGTEV